jgi:hypothetical protein
LDRFACDPKHAVALVWNAFLGTFFRSPFPPDDIFIPSVVLIAVVQVLHVITPYLI